MKVKLSDISCFHNCNFFQYLRTALHTACDENEGINIIALILECKGVDINARDEVRVYVVFVLVCLSQVQD